MMGVRVGDVRERKYLEVEIRLDEKVKSARKDESHGDKKEKRCVLFLTAWLRIWMRFGKYLEVEEIRLDQKVKSACKER